MTPAEALRLVRNAAKAGRLQFSRHALERMAERGAARQDVTSACLTATSADYQGNDVWKLGGGVDLEGDLLVVIASVDLVDVLVITVTG